MYLQSQAQVKLYLHHEVAQNALEIRIRTQCNDRTKFQNRSAAWQKITLGTSSASAQADTGTQVFELFRERCISNLSWRLFGKVCKAILSTPWPQSVPFSRDWNMLAVHPSRQSLAPNLASPDFYYLSIHKTGLLLQLKIHQLKHKLPNMNKSYLNKNLWSLEDGYQTLLWNLTLMRREIAFKQILFVGFTVVLGEKLIWEKSWYQSPVPHFGFCFKLT